MWYVFQPDRPGFESGPCFLISGEVTLGKSHDLSESQFAHLENGNMISILQGCCEDMIHGKHLAQCLAPCDNGHMQDLERDALKLLRALSSPRGPSLQSRPGGTKALASSPLPQSKLE